MESGGAPRPGAASTDPDSSDRGEKILRQLEEQFADTPSSPSSVPPSPEPEPDIAPHTAAAAAAAAAAAHRPRASPCTQLARIQAENAMRIRSVSWLRHTLPALIERISTQGQMAMAATTQCRSTAAHSPKRQKPLAIEADDGLMRTLQSVTHDSVFSCGESTVIATSSTWKDDVQFLGLHHDAAVSISVFLVREGGTIPLHSHPEMVVYSQLLFGELEETSYELLDLATPDAQALLQRSQGTGREIPARISGVQMRTPDTNSLSVIEPGRHDLHYVTARTCSAFFDVFTPPYMDGVRDCDYFKHMDAASQVAAMAAAREKATRPKSQPSDVHDVDPTLVLLEKYNPTFATGKFVDTAEAAGLQDAASTTVVR